jgi:hypothetical protein
MWAMCLDSPGHTRRLKRSMRSGRICVRVLEKLLEDGDPKLEAEFIGTKL